MKVSHSFNSTSALRAGSCVVLASFLVPLAGCGSPAPPPPVDQAQAPSMSRSTGNRNAGLTTKQKVVLLAGAAAMYYYYQKSKKANAAKFSNQNVQYYLSKNGRIYYRDPQTHQAIWVTPPPNQVGTVSVPGDQAQPYSQIQGYNRQTTGNNLDYYFNGPGGVESSGG